MDDRYYLRLALEQAEKGRCKRRKIGCVLVGDRGVISKRLGDYVVVGVGYNGPPDCMPSCFDSPCPAADIPAGKGNASTPCFGVHAEVRALTMALNNWSPQMVQVCYTNKAPCTACTLMLLNTSCRRIVFATPSNETLNREFWEKAGREWVHVDLS